MSLRSGSIRPPAVAGRFYPEPADVLRELIRKLTDHVDNASSPTGTIRAVIAPHAGYLFSGPVAATVFQLLRAQRDRVRRVVLFGPSHYEAFAGIAVPSAGAFATPLGDVAVDGDAVESLLQLPRAAVHGLDSPHTPEHALEVELPFLIDALGGADKFTIVPLLFADASSDSAAAALESLWDDDTLVVVSSDLSHYLDHDTAQQRDRATADAIVENRPHVIGPESACGHVAVRGLMSAAERLGLHCTCMDLRNSGDTAPHLAGRDRVVGYGAFVYTA